MKNQAYHFEIEDLTTQFIAAFDDCVIKRFNGRRVKKDQISVRYVYAPKQRVLYDIVNEGKNIILPVVAVNITQITRDPSRVFNKHDGFWYPSSTPNSPSAFSNRVGTPVPVNVSMNMSIIAKYQADIEQLISNFAAYTNPYLILVWKIPDEFNLSSTYEIRSEVEWNGSIALNYPGDITANDKYRVVADTSFTIKGWLFPEAPKNPEKNIFFINANFYAANSLSGNPIDKIYAKYDDYHSLSALNFNGFTESIHISAAPTITDIFYSSGKIGLGERAFEGITLQQNSSGDVVTLFGKRFQYTTGIALCCNNLNSNYGALSAMHFTYYDAISAYPIANYQVLNENIISINLPPLTAAGSFNFMVFDEAGYDVSVIPFTI